jgi:hypothetical protein
LRTGLDRPLLAARANLPLLKAFKGAILADTIGNQANVGSINYPFVENKPGTDWIKHIPLSAEDKAKLLNGKKRLLRM